MFACNKVEFLVYVISGSGLKICSDKIQAVAEWQTPIHRCCFQFSPIHQLASCIYPRLSKCFHPLNQSPES
jgi:hypothetical protein